MPGTKHNAGRILFNAIPLQFAECFLDEGATDFAGFLIVIRQAFIIEPCTELRS